MHCMNCLMFDTFTVIKMDTLQISNMIAYACKQLMKFQKRMVGNRCYAVDKMTT